MACPLPTDMTYDKWCKLKGIPLVDAPPAEMPMSWPEYKEAHKEDLNKARYTYFKAKMMSGGTISKGQHEILMKLEGKYGHLDVLKEMGIQKPLIKAELAQKVPYTSSHEMKNTMSEALKITKSDLPLKEQVIKSAMEELIGVPVDDSKLTWGAYKEKYADTVGVKKAKFDFLTLKQKGDKALTKSQESFVSMHKAAYADKTVFDHSPEHMKLQAEWEGSINANQDQRGALEIWKHNAQSIKRFEKGEYQRTHSAEDIESMGRTVKHFHDGMDRAPKFEGIVVQGSGQYEGYQHKDMVVGKIMESACTSSTSKVRAKALEFMRAKGIILKLKMKAGADVSNLVSHYSEHEVLWVRGSNYKITKVTEKSNFKWGDHLEVEAEEL